MTLEDPDVCSCGAEGRVIKGRTVVAFETHSCPQRRHRQPGTLIL